MSGRFGDLDDLLGDTRADVREGLEGIREVAARRVTRVPVWTAFASERKSRLRADSAHVTRVVR